MQEENEQKAKFEMTADTKATVPGSDVIPIDPTPRQFHEVRIILIIEAILLLTLGL